MAFMAFQKNFAFNFDFRVEQLKKDVIHVLQKYPSGVRKTEIWPLVHKETGREITSRLYGVNKMNRLLERWTDVITVIGMPDEHLILKKFCENKSNEKPAATPVVSSLMSECLKRKQASEAAKARSSTSLQQNTQESGEEGIEKSSKADETLEDSDSDCKIVDDEHDDSEDDERTASFDFLLKNLQVVRSWIDQYISLPENNNCGQFTKLKEHLRHKLRDKFNKKSVKQSTLKRFLREHCEDFILMQRAGEKSYHIYLHRKKDGDCETKTSTQPQTAMSLMTRLSQNNTNKSATSVIDLTDEKEGNKPSKSGGSLPFGAPANTTQSSTPLMSKFGAFPVPSKVIKPASVKPMNISNTDKGGLTSDVEERHFGPGRDLTIPGLHDHIIDLTFEPINKEHFERKQIDVRQVFVPRGTCPAREHVDAVAKECVAMLADAHENVTMERVEKLLCQRFNCYTTQQLGFRFPDQIPCINELNRLLCKINLYIIAFVKIRSVCTLYEVKEALREYAPGPGGFDSLKLGPLQRFPVVYQQFHFPIDIAEIPKITTSDILDHFHNYLTKYNLWSKKLDNDHFLDYLVEQYKADNPNQLGIKIRSISLVLAVLKKAQRDSGSQHNKLVTHFREELKEELANAFRRFRSYVLRTGSEGVLEVREHYLKLRPDLAVLEIFDKFSVLLMITQVGDRATTRAAKLRRLIEDFLTAVRGDDVAKNILHLAICMSNTAVEETAMKILTPQIVIDSDDESEQKQTVHKPPPRRDALIESLKTYLERCMNAGSITLTHLERIEERMLDDFDFSSFSLMGYGRFLEFLLREMKQLLEESGGLSLGQVSGAGDTESSFKPHHADLLEFVKQCRQNGLTQPGQIEEALCEQYSVKEVRHLSYGNITHLLSYADKHSRHTYRELTLVYESTLSAPKGFHVIASSKVGILGHQTKDAAKICLHNCPLLENLAEWSQWSLVFEPELGKLKDFVQKHGGVTNKNLEGGKLATLDFLALEVRPGEYVKIVSTTSPEHLASALERRDAQSAAGHLVSMAVAYKGVATMPLALLSGHIKSALLVIHAEETTPGQRPEDQHKACMFVLQCLLHIPTKVCVALANQLLLETLGQVVGSSKSKKILIQLCRPGRERNQLVQLGCLLGVPEWTDTIQRQCKLPDSAIQIIPPEAEELYKDTTQDDIELYDEDDDDPEDVDEILGDRLVTDDTTTKKTGGKTAKGKDKGSEKNEKRDEVPMEADSDNLALTERCEVIVNEIRKDEFGVGVHLSDDALRLMKVQQERLGRSLDRLSKDLYSKDTHFVLELVQNADDNSYHDNLYNSDSDECPSVKFVIEEDGIYVYNNELGFREKDIRALCDVGRSTKGKHKFGYIGQKGIGFKSVFRVTDAPEVHSNGYHIQFDVNSGPMGYILPHWVPEKDRISQQGWMTNIILRLKPEMRAQTRTLAARFNDIHPSLLLFLHRLRRIVIENKFEKSIQTIRRRDVGENVLEIQHVHGCDRWLIVKKVLDARKITQQVKSGADVESTELALAFPLQQNGQKISLQVLPPRQPVFAFLPLRSYGFRFIVQGDFDVPSSREDVDRDSPWNQWLRNEIHHLFIDALDAFKAHTEFSSMEAVCTFLQFVPMEDEVLDFFKPVAADILKKLKARPCIPTQPDSEGIVSWKMPSQTVRVRDPLIQTVITQDLLQKHLNLFYLHTDMSAILNPTLTSCLGIETLTSDHLLQLGKALIFSMENNCSKKEDIHLIAKWMACMYRSLDEIHEDESTLTELKSLAVLPLLNGQLVSVNDRSVFFPIEEEKSQTTSHKGTIDLIQQDVNSLHTSLLHTGDDEVNSQVHKLLLRLGVKQLSPFDVINHHIIPVLKSDAWQTKNEDILKAYIVYIKEQTELSPSVCNLEEVKDIAMVMTSQGFKNPSKDPVHFPAVYGNKINLQKTFPGYKWTLLDQAYLPLKSTNEIRQKWMDFFQTLGVEEFLSVRPRKVPLKREYLSESLWGSLSTAWPEEVEEFVVLDNHSVELEGLILNNQAGSGLYAGQMRQLCLFLDMSWEKYSNYCKTTVTDRDENVLLETDTSFSIILKTSEWLPASPSGTGKKLAEILATAETPGSVIMKEPSSLYIDSDSILKLLSDKVLYLSVKLNNQNFIKFLGLQTSVSVDTMRDHVIKWGQRNQTGKPVVFITSLLHMKNVYVFLDKELKRKEFQELLQTQPVYFVPNRSAPTILDKTEYLPGKMLKREEVWLSDKTGLFFKHQGILEAYHSGLISKRTIEGFYSDKKDLLELFKVEGKLDPQPTAEEYLELLCALCTSYTPKDAKAFSDVLYIYSTIGRSLVSLAEREDEESGTELDNLKLTIKATLQEHKVLPTVRKTWVSLSDVPLINDNKDFEKMFRHKAGVHILDLEDQAAKIFKNKKTKGKGRTARPLNVVEIRVQPDLIDEVIEVCGIQRLSDAVYIEISPSMQESSTDMQLYFSRMVPCLQQYLMARYVDIYQELKPVQIKQMLKDAKFYQTGKLEVMYWLTKVENTAVKQQEKCRISLPDFYVRQDSLTSLPEINKELARFFSCGDPDCMMALSPFLSELSNAVSEVTKETVAEVLMRYEVDSVEVPEEEKWEIEPPRIEPPVEPEPSPPPEPTAGASVEPEDSKEGEGNISVGELAPEVERKPLELPIWPTYHHKRVDNNERKNEGPVKLGNEMKEYTKSVKALPTNIRMIKEEGEVEEGGDTKTQTEQKLDKDAELIYKQFYARKRKRKREGGEMRRKRQLREEGSDGDTEVIDSPDEFDDSDDDGDYDDFMLEEHIIQDDAVWNKKVTEYEFDELGTSSDLQTDNVKSLIDGAADQDIGRWGEKLVFEYLTNQKKLGKIIDFIWVNDEEEAGQPFDFEILVKDESGIHKDFIEVKSTKSNNKEIFHISVQQIKFADDKKNRFHIYRIYNAGNADLVRLIRITDLDTRLSTKQLKLCMLI